MAAKAPKTGVSAGRHLLALIQKAGYVELLRRRPEFALGMVAAMSMELRVLVG